MSNNQSVKDAIIKGLKESIHPGSSALVTNKNSVVCPLSQPNIENELVVSKQFSKSIKIFLENCLLPDLNNHVAQIKHANKETWKIDAYNLSKALSDVSKLSCIQDNLSNILDSCLKEFDETGVQHFNDTDIDFSPLLQPEHMIEIAECISVEKPLDIRLNALRVLCKSHFTDTLDGEGWTLLQKELINNLSDNNNDIFVMCLKAHAKLASCSSPEAIKECSINLVESLGRHYYLHQGDCKATSLQSMHFYRTVYLVVLLLHTLKEITANVARFGESKIREMIENFIQLISINVSSKKPSKTKSFKSPLEILCFLDPYAKWALRLSHFNLSRQLLFSSLYKNMNFIKICVEEILDWLTDPVIPAMNVSKISEGELNTDVHKYSLFIHCLAALTTICTFGMSVSLFPVSICKKDSLISVEDILNSLITSINDSQFNYLFQEKATLRFRSFFALNVAKMMCLKQVNGNMMILGLLKPNDVFDQLLSPIQIEILVILSNICGTNNPLICHDLYFRKKHSLFSNCFINNNFSSNQHHGSLKQRREIEHQGSLGDSENNCTFHPFEVYLRFLLEKSKQNNLKKEHRLIVIMTNMFKNFEGILGIDYILRSQIIQLVGEVFINLGASLKHIDSTVDINEINSLHVCAGFLKQCAMTPIGFYILQELNLVYQIFYEELQLPEPNWSDYVWLNFVTKASATEEGFSVITHHGNNILSRQLLNLWNTIDEDCSGSELPIMECCNSLLRLITLFTSSLRGIKGLLSEPKGGSEVTLTDESDNRPLDLFTLIRDFALNNSNCPNLIYHQFSLTVLDILVSNIDSIIYLMNKFNIQELLLQLQADNRVDDSSDVIIDECSLLRQKIIEKTYLPVRLDPNLKPTHTFPRPDSTLTRTKPRSRGNGEFARWLSETRPGLHDHSWLKHARKLYRNSSPDDVKGTTIIDLLEQVLKVLPEVKPIMKWQQFDERCSLGLEEQLAVQLAVKFGAHHRIFQATQQNIDNLSQLILIVNTTLSIQTDCFNGFDWFVASSFLICSGSIEKAQSFLSLTSTLPTAPLLWFRFGEASTFAQLENVLDTIVSEEMPALFHMLQRNGLSWSQLCSGWMARCWWGVLDWPLICHWFMTAILYQPDHLLYFCVALLHSNHDRLLHMSTQNTVYDIVTNPAEKFQLLDARILIDKLHKKYHGTLHSYLVSI